MNLYIVGFIFSSVLILLAIQKMMSTLFEERRTSLWVATVSYLLYGFSTGITFLLFNIPIINITLGLITLFLITLNYKSTMKKRLVVLFGTYVVFGIADILVAFLLGFQNVSVLEYAGARETWGATAIGPVIYLLSLIFKRFKNIRKDTISLPIFWISTCLLPVLSYALLILAMGNLPQVVGVIFIIAILGINVLTFYLYDTLSAAYEDKIKSALHTQEKEYYFTQCQLMQESAEKVKSIRHDMKLHLATTRHYIANHKADEAMEYLNNLVGDINDSEIYSGTGNIAFDSIINFKLKNAIDDDIKLDIDVRVPSALNIEASDVVIILGNLLDNALDAVANIEEKFIRLNVEFNQGTLFIRVDNSFDGEVQYADSQNGTEQVIATRKDGDNHGYGLKNIQKSIEKYDGNMDISHEGNLFSVGVLLYIK